MPLKPHACLGLLWMSVATPLQQVAASPVRLSGNDVCHEATSPHYSRLRQYREFTTLDGCLDAGGRPVRGSGGLPVGPADPAAGPRWRTALRNVAGSPVVAVVLMLLLAWGAGWAWLAWQRRRQRLVHRRMADEERRRWEGHRRERRGP